MAVRAALERLLEGVAVEAPEDELLDYISSVLEDAEDEADLEAARELLGEACAGFGALAPHAQRDALLKAQARACSSTAAASTPSTSAAAAGPTAPAAPGSFDVTSITAAALVDSLRRLDCEGAPASAGPVRMGSGRVARTASATSGTSGSGRGADADGGGGPRMAADDVQNADPAALEALRELCGDVASDAFLAHVLVRRCRRDPEAAAVWLVESEVAAEEAAWREELEEQQQEAGRSEREQQKSKAMLLARFALQPVVEPSDGKQKERPVEAWTAGKKQQQPWGKIRYREGMVVSSSGEKYIVQKLAPDYDGGSRGRVFTKGKRGKGFV